MREGVKELLDGNLSGGGKNVPTQPRFSRRFSGGAARVRPTRQRMRDVRRMVVCWSARWVGMGDDEVGLCVCVSLLCSLKVSRERRG